MVVLRMSTRKKRNPLNLSLPPTVREDFALDEFPPPDPGDSTPLLDERLKSLSLSGPQLERMNEWLQDKQKIGPLEEDEFERLCELGNGNSGVVHKLRHLETGLIMARKLVHVEIKPSTQHQILKELDILHKCNCPYIVGFYGVYGVGNNISICMEYMNGSSLDLVLKKSGRITEPRIGRIVVTVLKGLTYLKEEFHILHRDIKPSNILVNSRGEIKLCDFGVSCTLIDSMANSFVGTRSYMAPERLTGVRYSIQSDIWSLGLSLVEIAIGRFPIPAPTRREYARMFDLPLDSIRYSQTTEEQEKGEDDGRPPIMMSIFDLLDSIVNSHPPIVPNGVFSDNFVEFVNKCLIKQVHSRADLRILMSEPFYTYYDETDTEREFTAWIQSVIETYGQT